MCLCGQRRGQPILEHAEPPEPEPAVSLDVPLQVSAEVPNLEHAEPSGQTSSEPDVPLQVSAESANLEHQNRSNPNQQ